MDRVLAPQSVEEPVPSVFRIQVRVADIDLAQRHGPGIAMGLGFEVDSAHRSDEVVHWLLGGWFMDGKDIPQPHGLPATNRDGDRGYVVTAADIAAELDRIGHELPPLEIVLVKTRAGGACGRPDYVAAGCGIGREATLYVLERGVRPTGAD